MQTVPLQPVPSQSTKVVLGGQNCQILVYQKPQGVFVDINAEPLVSREYAGFSGNLLFIDSQGSADPSYEGFGDRFALVYLTAEEYALI